jgi:hypothetical protein
VAVKVLQPSQSSRPTQADFFFESPGEILDWLECSLGSHGDVAQHAARSSWLVDPRSRIYASSNATLAGYNKCRPGK